MSEQAVMIELPDAPPVAGLRFRRFRGEADYPEMVAVIEGSKKVDQQDELTTLAELRHQYQHLTNCDPYQDLLFAEVEGRVIGYSRVYWGQEDRGDWIYYHLGYLLPAWRRQGIGGAMLHHCESRLRQIAASHPPAATRLLQVSAAQTEIGRMALYRAEGYRPVRYFVQMTRSLEEAIPQTELPEGLALRPVEQSQLRQIWEANVEAFQDHWGHRPAGEQDYQRWLGTEEFQPELWKVAWDGDQVAGMVLNFILEHENREYRRKRGYTEDICVRRPWRRRGLARALIVDSMRMLHDRGMQEAALDADTENLTGAFRLYAGLGYREVKRWTALRKPLD